VGKDAAVSGLSLDHLDPEQRAVAEAVRGRVVVIATAGSGKTRAITYRIANAVHTRTHDPATGLALSFTTRAANQLKRRVTELGVENLTTATIHAAALRQLNFFWPRVFGGNAWKVGNNRANVIDEVTNKLGLDLSSLGRRTLLSEIDWAKASGLDAASYQELDRSLTDIDSKTIGEIWGRYEDLCHTRRVIDFDDVLSLTVGMLSSRPDVVSEVRRRYTWFTVDEYQDITPLQNALLQLWVGERAELCVVGDPAQTIYSFAGAQANYLKSFAEEHPDATLIELVRTYRCPPAVVSAANSLMASQPDAAVSMVSQRDIPGTFTVSSYADEASEAQAIAVHIADLLQKGTDPREIAILLRINSMSEVFERALDELRIPYSVRGGARFFDRREIKQALLQLKAFSFSDTSMPLVDAVRTVLGNVGWQPSPPAGQSEAKESWEALSGLLALAQDVEDSGKNSMQDFFEVVAQRTMAQDHPTAATVMVTTMHAAKGLEWQHVFVPSVNEGVLPFIQNAKPHEIDEERRLLYVAITRASAAAYVSSTQQRFTQPALPSRFLAELGQTAIAVAPVARVVKPEKPEVLTVMRCSNCGAGLLEPVEQATLTCKKCPDKRSAELSAALREWRDETAAQLDHIPWLLLSDVTIDALSALKPEDFESLAQVSGMREHKVQQFGAEILTLIALHKH
jgi:DNA helicase-2/ATP-dependent DNA helicase PcrA